MRAAGLLAILAAGLLVGALTSEAWSQRRRADALRVRLDACAGVTGEALALAGYAEDLADRTDVCAQACVLRGVLRYGADARGEPPPAIAREP